MAGMRLQDYIERLTEDDYEDIFSNMEEEEAHLRAFLGKFEEEQLDAIATMLNDTFEMPDDGMEVTDFIVTLYKCQRADFYFDNVDDAVDCIKFFVREELIDDIMDDELLDELD